MNEVHNNTPPKVLQPQPQYCAPSPQTEPPEPTKTAKEPRVFLVPKHASFPLALQNRSL